MKYFISTSAQAHLLYVAQVIYIQGQLMYVYLYSNGFYYIFISNLLFYSSSISFLRFALVLLLISPLYC